MTLNRSLSLRATLALLSLAPVAGMLCWAAAVLSGSVAPGQEPAARKVDGGASAPKRLLVVSTTLGFRHPSIEVGEKVLRDLARRSGRFTLEFASVNPNDPKYAMDEGERAKSARGGLQAFGPGSILAPAMVSQADKDRDKAVTKGEFAALADAWYNKLDADKSGKIGREPFATRLGDLLPFPGAPPRRAEAAAPQAKRRRSAPPINLGLLVGPRLFTALDADMDGSLTREEMKTGFDKWAAAWDADKSGALGEAEVRDGLNAAMPGPFAPGFERNAKAEAAVREVLAEKMSPEGAQAVRRHRLPEHHRRPAAARPGGVLQVG